MCKIIATEWIDFQYQTNDMCWHELSADKANVWINKLNTYDHLKQLISKLNPFSTTGRCLVCKCDRLFEHLDNCEYIKFMEDNNG